MGIVIIICMGRAVPAQAAIECESSAPSRVRLAIVGSGPHALTLLAHARRAGVPLAGSAVLDRSGRWLGNWRDQFAAHAITHLRSGIVHHPDPAAEAYGRWAAGRPSLIDGEGHPTAAGFERFCDEIAARTGLSVRRAAVARIEAAADGVRLHQEDGRILHADRAVLACNPSRPTLPGWAQAAGSAGLGAAVCHSSAVDVRLPGLAGRAVVVVGGGLTAAQLAVAAHGRGAAVTLIHRGRLRARLYDIEPGWFGPYRLERFLRSRDPDARLRDIRAARDGGRMTLAARDHVQALAAAGAIDLRTHEEVAAISQPAPGRLAVELAGGDALVADRVWCATGFHLDAGTDPLLELLHSSHPVPLHGGLPVLDEALSWAGLPIHVMGGYAALQVGPVAANLGGARMAARRILPALACAASARDLPAHAA